MSVVDGAFVFDDSDHLHRFFTSEASQPLKDGFLDGDRRSRPGRLVRRGSPVHREQGRSARRTDLEGLRMRFPPSPQFLMNAAAMGATAVEVAFEELYLALQQGTVDGQENPINNIAANNIQEVQDFISMSSHQLNSNLVVINEEKWAVAEPRAAGGPAGGGRQGRVEVPECVEEFETTTLDGLASEQDDRDRRGRRPRGVPDQGRGLPPRELHRRSRSRSWRPSARRRSSRPPARPRPPAAGATRASDIRATASIGTGPMLP